MNGMHVEGAYTDDVVVMLRAATRRPEFNWSIVCRAAADEILQLRAALALAVGELSTHGEYTAWNPEQLMNQFLEEASNA